MNFTEAFNQARNSGKGIFTWNGKTYNTMKEGEDINTFRSQHDDFNTYMT